MWLRFRSDLTEHEDKYMNAVTIEGISPATIAEANGAIVFLREQGADIAAEAVEKLLQHRCKTALRPNVMRCGGCNLRVTGMVTTASCPNGCGPLWPATWKEECLSAERERDEYVAAAKIKALTKLTRVEIDRIAHFAIDSDHLAKDEWESAGLYDFAHAVSGGIGVVDDLAALVRRLAHALKNAKPDNSLVGSALDFLKRHGIDVGPLRVESLNEGEGK